MATVWSPEVLCVLGRGIEKVNGKWQPTQYVERQSETNEHPGVRAEGITPWDDDPRVVIAGGEINALALGLFYRHSVENGRTPRMVVFAGGRPRYLRNEHPAVSEGGVMYRYCLRFIDPMSPETEIEFQPQNRNTRDDIVETLILARRRGFSRIVMISVRVHVPRCVEFMHHVPPQLLEETDVRWFASEDIVLHHRPDEYEWLHQAMVSPAYQRTGEREAKGIADLRAGRYNFDSEGYQFAPTE